MNIYFMGPIFLRLPHCTLLMHDAWSPLWNFNNAWSPYESATSPASSWKCQIITTTGAPTTIKGFPFNNCFSMSWMLLIVSFNLFLLVFWWGFNGGLSFKIYLLYGGVWVTAIVSLDGSWSCPEQAVGLIKCPMPGARADNIWRSILKRSCYLTKSGICMPTFHSGMGNPRRVRRHSHCPHWSLLDSKCTCASLQCPDLLSREQESTLFVSPNTP